MQFSAESPVTHSDTCEDVPLPFFRGSTLHDKAFHDHQLGVQALEPQLNVVTIEIYENQIVVPLIHLIFLSAILYARNDLMSFAFHSFSSFSLCNILLATAFFWREVIMVVLLFQ